MRGQKLPTEYEMMGLFGVGRGVVREAVRMLDAMGLVESRRGSGIYVRNDPIATISRAFTFSVTPEEESIVHLFEFRAMLEADAVYAVALRRSDTQVETIDEWAEASLRHARAGDAEAFSRANEGFHAALREATGNPYLAVALVAVREMLQDVMRLIARVPGSVPAAEQHRAIVAAIARRDADEAAALMRAHVRYTSQRLQAARDHAESGGDATATR